MTTNFNGLGVALVTPFDEQGKIDFDALRRLVDHVIAGGVDYIIALGTTAETPTISQEERAQIVRTVVAQTAERVPIIVGMSGNNTADLAGKIATADLKGVAAILSATPYYNKPSQEGLYSHYKAVASFSPVPVILYNVPSRTGVNMEAATTLRLAQDFENIIGIKEAHNNTEQMAALIKGRPAGFYVLSGDDMTAAELIGMGGDGLISVPANAYPAEMKRLVDAAINGRRAEVTEMVGRMYPMIHLMFKEGSPTGIKAVLAMKGMIRNELRLPLVPASDTLCEQMKRVMAEERL